MVIPVLLGQTKMPAKDDLPATLAILAFYNAVTVDPGVDFEHHVDRLIRRLVDWPGKMTRPVIEPVERPAAPHPAASRPKPDILLWSESKILADRSAKNTQEAWAVYLGIKKFQTIALSDEVNLEMVLVPPGRFMMGSPPGETGHAEDEILHEVELTRPYFLGKFAVTQQQFETVLQVTDSSSFTVSGDGKEKVQGLDTRRFPVEQVSWEEATQFCSRLNDRKLSGFGQFRLPTEAQWEYACRSGTMMPFYFGAQVELRSELRLRKSLWNTNQGNPFEPYERSWKWNVCCQCAGVIRYAWKRVGMVFGLVWRLQVGHAKRSHWRSIQL